MVSAMFRRKLIQGAISVAALIGGPAPVIATGKQLPQEAVKGLVDLIEKTMQERHIPGLSACLLDRDGVIWQHNFGFADLARQVTVTPDHLQNIASISKTFTALAAMQQVEAGNLSLDADLNEYLPFELRNPRHPGRATTLRMLMEHTSSLLDGEEYSRKYGCGDPDMSLKDWVHACLKPGGAYYDADDFFAAWEPGAQQSYCNVSFGLMGYLVEIASGEGFPAYCHDHIFQPLGMADTAWMLADIDPDRHLVPYSWAENGTVRGPSWGGLPLGVIQQGGPTLDQALDDGYHANCAYNHPNYPDGFLRTSLNQLVTWAQLWLNDGTVNDVRLLQAATVQQMMKVGNIPGQGLTWHKNDDLEEMAVWGHSGGDPGVNTDLSMLPEEGLAAIVFINTDGVRPTDFTNEILRVALRAL
jgi:CubicO group peptidase (beta-lactamase class C family)